MKLAVYTPFLLILLSGAAQADPVRDSAEARKRLDAFAKHQKMLQESPYKSLEWTFVGPVTATGRISDVEAIPGKPTTIYVGAASGGVFKTEDDGATWLPIFENQASAVIGDIAIAPSDPNIVWVGTGEANILRSSMAGTGVYKSTDGGKTFKHMGLTDSQHIARILVHPQNPNIVYVAVPGHEYTYNKERGVYKTTDGGKTWSQVFFKDEKTGVIDLAMDPQHPDTLYAGTAERLRKKWNDPIATAQSGIYKTTDGGKTWRYLTNGLPDFSKGECERIGISVCASKPNVVYTVINSNGALVFRSDDFGEHWRQVEGNDKMKNVFPDYGWYFGQIRVDPNDPDDLFVIGLVPYRSKDGGKTWETFRGSHVDYHGMWIDPQNSNNILVTNDGGLMISHDGLATFKDPDNLPIAQLYNVAVTQTAEKIIAYSSRQDTGAWRGEITVGPDKKITWTDWKGAPGDEAGRHAVDPTNENLLYYVNRYGGGPFMVDYSKSPPARKTIAPKFEDGTAKRAQWVSPIVVSPADPSRILFGAQFVFVSDDRGATWRKASPDLTNFDPQKQGNIPFSTVFAIAESPLKKGVIWAGTDDGNVQVTRNDGATWTNVSAGLPKDRFIAWLEASRSAEGTAYVVVNGKRNDDFETYVYKTEDFGSTWKSIKSNLPGGSANVIKEDPANPKILYLGTDLGVYVTTDGGKKWETLGSKLPTVYVHDIAIDTKENVMIIATHGRGCFAIPLDAVRAMIDS
jgi:photosystem II stability/assembly factor-like uncharacterized protein